MASMSRRPVIRTSARLHVKTHTQISMKSRHSVDKIAQQFEFQAVQKCVNFADLEKSIKISSWSQKSALMQPRTSLAKFLSNGVQNSSATREVGAGGLLRGSGGAGRVHRPHSARRVASAELFGRGGRVSASDFSKPYLGGINADRSEKMAH